jgi:Xaa-Pro dipeptidase
MNPFTAAEVTSETSGKLKRLRESMAGRQHDAVCLTLVKNFSWITGGLADSQIAHSSEVGGATIIVTQDGRKFVVAPHSEIPRLMDQALGELGYEPIETKWYAPPPDLYRQLRITGTVSSDVPRENCAFLDITRLRRELTETEIKKYRCAGLHCAEAVAEITRQIRPGMTERQIEVMTAHALMQRGLRPTVLLIGSDERIYRYRHCLPSDKPVEKYAMVNVCARGWGLVVSTTRFVHFGPLGDELQKRLRAAAIVNAHYMAALRPRRRIADIFEQAKGWYADQEFPGEWEFHHQGGGTGYSEREYIIGPDSEEVVLEHEAFAFNPTVQGAKAEDTVITFGDHVQNLTATADWPALKVMLNGCLYPCADILISGAPQTVWEGQGLTVGAD